MKTIIKLLPDIALPLLAFSCSVYIMFNCMHENYELLFILPLLYFILSFFLLRNFSEKSSVFYVVINMIIFFRYVVSPYLIVSNGYYEGRSPVVPQKDSFVIAHLLMLEELLAVVIVLLYKEIKFQKKGLSLFSSFPNYRTNHTVYFAFIVFIGIYAFVDRNWIGVIHFITPVVDLSNETTFSIHVPYLILMAKQILVVVMIYKIGKRYKVKPKIYLLITAFILAFLNISIFLGTNRSDILIPAIATLILLKKIFNRAISNTLIITSLVAVLLVINVVTEARGMKKLDDKEQNYSELLNAYLGGVYNVAIAKETVDYYPEVSKPKVLFYDLFRSMIGVNFFLKGNDVVWSNIYFNKRLLREERSSQILPMIGQGYIFFNFFAPVLSVSFVLLAYALIDYLYKTRDPLVFYFLLLCVIRTGFFMGQNTMNQINDLSFNLALFALLYFLNNKFLLKI